MKKRLTSFILVLAFSFSLSVSAFAVDDSDYYSLPPVGGSEPSVAMDWPVNPAEFDNNDSITLTNIYKYIQYLTLSPASWQSNSVIGFLEKIFDRLPSNLGTNFALQGGDGTNSILDDVRKWTMFTYNSLTSDNIAGNLGKIQQNTLASADRLLSLVSALGDGGFATENTLSSFFSYFSDSKFVDSPWTTLDGLNGLLGKVFDLRRHTNYTNYDDFPYQFPYYDPATKTFGHYNYSFSDVLGHLMGSLLVDQQFYASGTGWTLYHYVKNLSETLASEDDKQLAENYKENRAQAESDFLSGQSGKTSLGKGDFSNASQVGGALNDTFNMGGAAKVSDFLSGFGSAGTESQAWFSQTTANNLNAVEAGDGTSGVSTFADDGETMVDVDPDPYNMGNIFERYDWLEGVNMDD